MRVIRAPVSRRKGLCHTLQQQPLLGVHQDGFALRDAEGTGVEDRGLAGQVGAKAYGWAAAGPLPLNVPSLPVSHGARQ